MQKGQAIIEFIFLILIIVVYIVSVTMPLIDATKNIVQDTENITRANNECQKIVNSIKEINLFGEGSRQTLDIFIPNNTKIDCNAINNKILFETQLTQTPYPAVCPLGKCTKEFAQNINLICEISQINGPQKVGITIQKTNGNITFLRSE